MKWIPKYVFRLPFCKDNTEGRLRNKDLKKLSLLSIPLIAANLFYIGNLHIPSELASRSII